MTTEAPAPDPSARSRRVASVFDRSALTYDSVGVPWFTPIAEHLVQELAPAPGERALDVGSGRGAVLFALAAAVGPTGQVSGIDLAPGMVQAVQADVKARGLRNVDIQLMDASAPDLGGTTFDLLASSLVLFFLPDPAGALRNWHELLKPGGRVGVTTFGPIDPKWVAVDSHFRPYLPKELLDARASGLTGPFGSDEGVADLFAAAGFVDIRTTSLDLTATFRDADHWHEWSWSHGQRVMWEAVPEERRPEVRAATAASLEAARTSDGPIELGQRVRYTLARR